MSPTRFYRTMLWCYPAPFREEYGAEMACTFLEQLREARQRAAWRGEALIWLTALYDLLVTAPREHSHMIRQDLRYAIRTLVSQPGFAAVAILSLALGIGANTAIFSLLNSVLFSSLPVHDPQRLVLLTDPTASGVAVGSQGGERALLTYAEFRQLQDQTTVFSALMASQSTLERLQARVAGGEPEELHARMVSAEYFTTLGVPALLGRTFLAMDDPAAANAVISYAYWQRRFGLRADILGTRINIHSRVFSIIGVAPGSFFGETVGQCPDVWLPLTLQASVLPGRDWLHDQPAHIEKVMWLQAFGRLKSDVSLEQAQAAANVTFQQELRAYYGSALTPAAQKEFMDQRLKLRQAAAGVSQLREQFAKPLTMLLIAAALVLLIACTNLGNLLLARSAARTREISVRLALGAGRARLTRQLLTESIFLAFLGGLAGLAAAWMLRVGLLRLVSGSIYLPFHPDPGVLGFAFSVTLLSGFILGVLPVLRLVSMNSALGLKEQGRGITASSGWVRAGKMVVVGQLALSVPLLVGAGLLIRTLQNLQNVDLGYVKEHLLIVEVDAQTAGYPEPQRPILFQQLLERIRAVPGVRTATYSNNGLFSGSDSGDRIAVEGYTPTGRKDRGSRYNHVGPNYFSAIGVPLLTGREITDRDTASSNRVCVINEAFASLFFAGRNPLGMHVTQIYGNQRNTCEVIGVTRNSRGNNLRGEIEPRFYLPATQPVFPLDGASFSIRTAAEPNSVMAAIRHAILSLNPNLPITVARPLGELIDERIVEDRLVARLSVAFGAVALLLAAIGIYGVLSYGVARRTNEIGIRKALGAQHRAVVMMILRETGLLLLAGVGVGIVLSIAVLRLIRSSLYGLGPANPLVIAGAITTLTAVAIVAAWAPAHRASRVDPLVALRHE